MAKQSIAVSRTGSRDITPITQSTGRFQVETNVPMPTTRRGPQEDAKFPFKDMVEGASFGGLIGIKEADACRAAAQKYRSRHAPKTSWAVKQDRDKTGRPLEHKTPEGVTHYVYRCWRMPDVG